MIKKTPGVSIQEITTPYFMTNNLMPSNEEVRIELHRRLSKFEGERYDTTTRLAIACICQKFNEELLHNYPGYFGRFGFDIAEKNGCISISPYAKNIRTLLATLGYMMYALECPEDALEYTCSVGRFCVKDGRAMRLKDQ